MTVGVALRSELACPAGALLPLHITLASLNEGTAWQPWATCAPLSLPSRDAPALLLIVRATWLRAWGALALSSPPSRASSSTSSAPVVAGGPGGMGVECWWFRPPQPRVRPRAGATRLHPHPHRLSPSRANAPSSSACRPARQTRTQQDHGKALHVRRARAAAARPAATSGTTAAAHKAAIAACAAAGCSVPRCGRGVLPL
jgi:hypothetical protein